MTYSEKLKDPRWQKKRLEIMERDEFACRVCLDYEKTLHVHHRYYQHGLEPWDYPDGALLTLCETCHERWHLIGDFYNHLAKQIPSTDLDILLIWVTVARFESQGLRADQCSALAVKMSAKWSQYAERRIFEHLDQVEADGSHPK